MVMNINPKVAMGAAGGGFGGACVVLLLWWFQDGLGIDPAKFTLDRIVALTTVMTVGPGFLAGWLTSMYQAVKPINLTDEVKK